VSSTYFSYPNSIFHNSILRTSLTSRVISFFSNRVICFSLCDVLTSSDFLQINFREATDNFLRYFASKIAVLAGYFACVLCSLYLYRTIKKVWAAASASTPVCSTSSTVYTTRSPNVCACYLCVCRTHLQVRVAMAAYA